MVPRMPPSRRRHTLALTLLLTPGCAQPVLSGHDRPRVERGPQVTAQVAPYEGVFTATLDNDLFVGDDDSYTNGFGLTWTSRDVSLEEQGFAAAVSDAADFLPFVDDGPTFVSVTFGQEMFTPSDITLRNPPRDEQPYAGLLFLDLATHTRDGDDLHSYKLRLGVVGPSSGAEYAQRKVHELIDADEPQGWDTGLEDEVVLNAYYDRSRRVVRTDVDDPGLHTDLNVHGGVALGTWATVAHLGATLRFGDQLPDTFGVNSLRSGRDSNAVLTQAPEANGSYVYGFFGLNGTAVAHYMPLDGTVFRDSRSVDSRPFVAGAQLGVLYGSGAWVTSLAVAVLSDSYDGQPGTARYGSISVSTWY